MITLQHADEQTFAALLADTALPCGLPVCPGGLDTPEVMGIVAAMAAGVREGFSGESAWLVVANGEVVGLISYKVPPANGAADIGYGIGATRRRRGHATAAVRALAAHARAAGLARLTAETARDNRGSRRALEANGFVAHGERDDPEDGRVICWLLDLNGER
jgi:RimJ/RimL family protein N-acetyltransferase